MIDNRISLESPDSFTENSPTTESLAHLEKVLQELNMYVEARYQEMQTEDTPLYAAVDLLDEILNRIYDSFRGSIPYNRIGFSLIEADGQTVRAYWARSDRPLKLARGYAAPLKGSSLEFIVQSGYPRIINDLETYLRKKPTSEATRLIVEEGMRSSLTCPLKANHRAVGFLFFSSIYPQTYSIYHIKIFKQIANQLSLILEKGRVLSVLVAPGSPADQNLQ